MKKVSSYDMAKLTKRQITRRRSCIIKKWVSYRENCAELDEAKKYYFTVLALSLSVTTAPSSSSFSTMLCLLSRAASINGVNPLSCKGRKKNL